MTGTKVPLKIIPTHRTASAKTLGDVLPADLPAPHKPKLLDRLWEAQRLRHYSRRTEQTYMIYTHVLNLGPTGVSSPVDTLRQTPEDFYADPYKTPS
jgi:hypothetical protein